MFNIKLPLAASYFSFSMSFLYVDMEDGLLGILHP